MGRKLKNISSKIFTLSYPRYRFFIFLIVLILLFFIQINFLESTPNLSICSRVLGKYCLSIGLIRGVSCLLKGNFLEAINYNLLSIPVLIILVGFIIHDFLKEFVRNKK